MSRERHLPMVYEPSEVLNVELPGFDKKNGSSFLKKQAYNSYDDERV